MAKYATDLDMGFIIQRPEVLQHPHEFDPQIVQAVAIGYMESLRAEAHWIGSVFHLRKTKQRREAISAIRQQADTG